MRRLIVIIMLIVVFILNTSFICDDNYIVITPLGNPIFFKYGNNDIGTGTLSFLYKDRFICLAHNLSYGMLDVPDVNDVDITLCYVIPKKSTDTEVGKLIASKDYTKTISIKKSLINSSYGLYGKYTEELNQFTHNKKMKVAKIDDIKLGHAQILTTIEGDKPKLYDIEIIEVIKKDNKEVGIRFVATDPELLNKAGGFIVGMSGSPIIQNNKMIGNICYSLYPKAEGIALLTILMIEELNKNY